MSSNDLPPHWTRDGRPRPRSARPVPANRSLRRLPAVPVPVPDGRVCAAAAEARPGGLDPRPGGLDPRPGGLDPRPGGLDPRPGGLDPRVSSVQSEVQFLQQQHQQTLEKLHAEVEQLRRGNKELQYKIIMKAPNSSRKGLTNGQQARKSTTQSGEVHTGLQLEEPSKNTRLLQEQELGFAEGSKVRGSARLDHGADMKGHLITSLDPLQIHSSPPDPPHAPTLQECEVIIRQLYKANRSQSQEIIRLKTLLNDIVLSKKITPQNYILTKTIFINGNGCGPSQSRVVLPALKQSFSSSVTDRQKRTRAVQRECFKRTQQ